MSDLVAFLRARLDEDEATAKAAAQFGATDWFTDSSEEYDERSIRYTGPSTLYPGELADYPIADRIEQDTAPHIARHDPARVLREVEAIRAIVQRHEPFNCVYCASYDWCPEMLHLGAIYRDDPDYDPEWKP